MNIDELPLGTPIMMPLVTANELISQSVSHVIADISDKDYSRMLSENRMAVVFRIDAKGRTPEISERMLAAIDSAGYDSNDVIYAVEVAEKGALAPDVSIICEDLRTRSNLLREVLGTDGKVYEDETKGDLLSLTYTNVILGIIIPLDL